MEKWAETDSSRVLQTQSPSLDLMCLCYTAVTAISRTQGGDRVSFKCLSLSNKSMIKCKLVNSSTNFLCKIRFPCYSAPCGNADNAYLCCVIYCIPRRFWTQSRRVSLSMFEAQQCCMWLVDVCWTHSGSQHDGSVLLKDPLLLLLIPRQPKLVNLKPSLWRTHTSCELMWHSRKKWLLILQTSFRQGRYWLGTVYTDNWTNSTLNTKHKRLNSQLFSNVMRENMW